MRTMAMDKGSVQMIAHRGASGLECENSAAAFVAAGNRSYWGIETDVHVTKDGEYVVIHDDTTGRVGNVDLSVEGSTLAQLRAVRLQGYGPRRDLVIPMLDDYLKICRRYGKVAVLELKNPMEETHIRGIVQRVREEAYLESTVFISFCWENLLVLRHLLPEQPIQFLTAQWDDALPLRLVEQGFGLDIYYPQLTEERVRKLHEMGIRVNCWTCDDPNAAALLVQMGVDQITSNILE